MQIASKLLFDAQAVGSTTVTSEAVPLDMVCIAALQITGTGTPTGSLTVEVSLENPGQGRQPTSWITKGSAIALAGSVTATLLEYADMGYLWLRVKYAGASSTGTLTVRYSGKGA